MESNKHTPGPWTIDNTRCNSKSLRIMDPSTGYAVADAFAHEQLIAAAPDMAEALRLAYEFLDANYSTADMPDILPIARAALAKAGL